MTPRAFAEQIAAPAMRETFEKLFEKHEHELEFTEREEMKCYLLDHISRAIWKASQRKAG